MGVIHKGVAIGLVVLAALLQVGHAQINAACTQRLDLIVALDASGSVNFGNFYNWQNAKQVTQAFLRNFTIAPNRVHVALIMITDRAVINFNFRQGNNANFVMRTIAALPNPTTSSRTNLADGFRVAREQLLTPNGGDRPDVQNVLILLSDGRPTQRIPETIPEANNLKRNTVIVTVAITGNPDYQTLRQISSSPDQPIVSFDQLYITQNFLTSQDLDLAILMDSSGSIIFLDINNWYYAKLFLQYLVESLEVDRGRTRVAAVTFNETATIRFRLQDFRDVRSIVLAIQAIPYTGGRTNLAAGLRLTRTQIFNEPPVPNRKRVTLIITDGMPTDEPGNVEIEANLLKSAGVDIISVVVQSQRQRQVDRQRLLRLASIVSTQGISLKPAVMEVTDYRALGTRVNSVVDQICSIPIGRSPADDLRVPCYRTCRDENRGNQLLPRGNYHFCPLGRITSERDCANYIFCDSSGRMLMIGCPRGTMFDDSIKACTWKSCSCPGGTRRCFRPFGPSVPGTPGFGQG